MSGREVILLALIGVLALSLVLDDSGSARLVQGGLLVAIAFGLGDYRAYRERRDLEEAEARLHEASIG